jgi:radical SAM protein with 4Fe4S-binding SPASM domain
MGQRTFPYYRLRDGCSLRGWQYNPYALVREDWYAPTDLTAEEFSVLNRCDGQGAFAEDEPEQTRALLERYVSEGVIEGCAEPRPVPDRQRYRLYPCWRFEVINWAVTGRCNYRCRHCFAAADLNPTAAHPSTEQCLAFVEQLASCGIRHVWLTGGEPLLREDFLTIARALAEAGIRIEDIGTNASLITPDLLDALWETGHHPQFNVSFDGLGHHDWLRGTEGAEERTLKAIALLKDRGVRVKVQYCLWDGNLDTLRESTKRLAAMGADHLRLIRVVEAPRWKAAEYGHTLGIREYYDRMLEILGWYLEEGTGMELEAWSVFDYTPRTGSCRLIPVKHCSAEGERLASVCDDARQMPFVTGSGSLTLCNQISGWEAAHGIEHGNVYRTPLTELLSDSPFTRQLLVTRARVREHNPECRECGFRSLCGCGCRAVALAATDDLLGKDPTACAFFKGGYRERFEAVLKAHGIAVM